MSKCVEKWARYIIDESQAHKHIENSRTTLVIS